MSRIGYLLIGLAGELKQSPGEWITRGSYNVVAFSAVVAADAAAVQGLDWLCADRYLAVVTVQT